MKRTAPFILAALTALMPTILQAADLSVLPENTQLVDPAMPVTFSADDVTYERALSIVTARGNVEVNQKETYLKADTLSYNMKEDRVTASGNVVTVASDGSVAFADYVELSGDLKNGAIKNIRIILKDKSRLAAYKARREDGTRHVLNKAVYSPCDVCKETGEPLWQVKAEKIVHDQNEKEIVYRHARLELGGIPIFYTPYMSHPDPSVKQISGFLPPTFGGTKGIGASLTLPYYMALSPQADMTLKPILSSDEQPVLGLEHRRYLHDGAFDFEGSITHDTEDRTRSHIDGTLSVYHDPIWRTEMTLQRASDDTYLRRYGLERKSDPWLQTDIAVEGFHGYNYAALRGYTFQDLREDSADESTPFVLPYAEWSIRTDPAQYGGYWTIDSSLFALERDEGAKSRRLSSEAAWHLPYVSPEGEIYRLTAALRGDGYYVEDQEQDGESDFDGTTGRVHPRLSMMWRYPLARREEASQQIIEPIVMGVISPQGGNPDKIPNEDSRDLEFDDLSLLVEERFTGLDRVETGPRINYALNWSIYGEKTGQVSAFIGQSYRFLEDTLFPEESGLEKDFSDYVGRIFASPGDFLDMSYRFRIDRGSLESRRNEMTLSAGTDLLRLTSDYMFINGSTQSFTDYEDREEIGGKLETHLTRYLSAGLYGRHDLTDDGGLVHVGGNLRYEDECLLTDFDVRRNYTHDRDYESGYSLILTVTFKTLGQIRTGN